MSASFVSLFVLLDLVSVVPAGLVAFIFLRSYTYLRSLPLESLGIGFGVLAVSYLLVAVASLDVVPEADALVLLSLALQTLAFSFIAAGYWLRGREDRATWVRTALVGLLVFVVSLLVLYALVPPPFDLPDVSATGAYFRGTSMLILLYVSARAWRSFVDRPETRTANIPIAFIVLAVGQYTWLIWSIEGAFAALALAYVDRLVGLGLFLKVILDVRGAPRA